MDKIKKVFKSVSFRNGGYSVGITGLVIAIAVVVNLIAGQLPESIRNIDISDNKIYEISDTSRELLSDLDQKITFQIFAEKSGTDERIKTFVEKYAALSNKISIEWIDPVLHPGKLTEYNVSEDTILITGEDSEKSTTVAFTDIILYDEYSYYTTGSATESEFDGEGQLTSAINYVISDSDKKIYYTTGHGEQTFSVSVSDLFDKNNMTSEEINLMMNNEIPEDCDLLFLYAPTSDLTDDEKELISDYLAAGGNVFYLMGDAQDETPNLEALLNEYGMSAAEGYIADTERCYQGNYYYIFPEISASGDLAEGLSSEMVLMINAKGLNVTDAERDTITVTSFMTTSSNAYAVTEESQEQGTYTLGAVATETISTEEDSDTDADEDADEDTDETEDAEAEEVESRLTVISSDSMINSEVTSSFSTLENLDLFMNAISAYFDDVQNVAIESKSLEVTYNTMQYTGLTSLIVIFGLPALFLICGFLSWRKRRKA